MHFAGISQVGRAVLRSLRGITRPAGSRRGGARAPCKDGDQHPLPDVPEAPPIRRWSLMKVGGLCERSDQ